MMRVNAGFAVLLLCIAFGCHRPGLKRTSFDNWEVRELAYIGARVEIPTDYYYSGGDSPTEAGYSLHPVWPPRGLLSEPRCVLEILLLRKSLEQVQQDERWATEKEGDEDVRRFWRWDYSRHEVIDRLDDGPQIVYRYDLVCPDETILIMSAVLMKMSGNDTPEYLDKDDAAIRRILSSVECIEQQPVPAHGVSSPAKTPSAESEIGETKLTK